MEEFLKTVARHYLNKVSQQTVVAGLPGTMQFSRYLFCFPNRRSGLFFARYLQEVYNEGLAAGLPKRPCCVPAIITINELFGHFSTRHVLDRTALLFRLFHIYDKLSTRREKETFDQFVFWGDMLLSDFDDVDKYLVDADKLFTNVRDLKEIDARFSGLTTEQVKIIRTFWQNFNPDTHYPEGDKHEVFGQTWAILSQLYHAFRESLMSRNEAYSGMMEREVVEQISANDDADPFATFAYEKVVFVGLTAISKVDRKLMSLLKLHGRAEFCWDYADERLHPKGSKATSAAYFSKSNLSDFGNELSDEELRRGLVSEEDRHVSLYSVASGVGQTRQARRILQHWKETIPNFNPLRTAVVLPDERLLLPMLYAVPHNLGTFNVTMGYNLSNTPVAALVSKLIALQQAWRSGDQTFYYRQVLPVLAHSFTLTMAGDAARKASNEIVTGNCYHVQPSMFVRDSFLSKVFRHPETALEAICYIDEILDMLMQRAAKDVPLNNSEDNAVEHPEQYQYQLDLSDEGGQQLPDVKIFSGTDYEFLYHYRKVLTELGKQVEESALAFAPKTLFLLLEKLVAGVSVPFSGEPLRGLQVMGVLETRALDFDNVIILSMNEGVFPAKPVQNTFVPMSLRDAFGMPTQRHRDSIFAYHFYRMISRASRLAMIYDSRSDGMQTGEESRYVKQLRYLMGHDRMVTQTVSDNINVMSTQQLMVSKTPDVMDLLKLCLGADGSRNISASVLKDYIHCPLKFYLGFVRQLREDDDVTEGVDAALFGDILHQAVHDLYEHCEGKEVQATMLKTYIDSADTTVFDCVRKAFSDKAHITSLEGYNLLIAGLIKEYIVELLRHDMQLCPFTYLAGERKHRFVFDAGNGLQVRIKCIYDRLDQTQAGMLRIVDYKTGNSNNGDKLKFPSVEDLFSAEGRGSSEAFQVMLYCLMFENASAKVLNDIHLDAKPTVVTPHLYFVRDFSARQKVCTSLTLGGKQGVEVTDFAPYRDEFRTRLSDLLSEIFDPDKPFVQCANDKHCKYCAFGNLCNRS